MRMKTNQQGEKKMKKYTLKIGSEFTSALIKSTEPTSLNIALLEEKIFPIKFFEVELDNHKYPVGTKMVLWLNQNNYSICTTKVSNLKEIN